MAELVNVAELLSQKGQAAIVTGAAEGMGREIARYLAAAGAAVVLADRNLKGVETAAHEIEADGGKAIALVMDIADEASVVAGVKEARRAVGPIHVLVNNAGIQDRVLLEDTDAAFWDRIMGVNLRGPFLVLREVAKLMKADGVQGRIINISSMGSLLPLSQGLLAYNATKAGVNGLTRNAALELGAHGITVNAILPGPVPTAGSMASTGPALSPILMQKIPPPVGRVGEPKDIASTALFLASGATGYITGQMFLVDGGFTLT